MPYTPWFPEPGSYIRYYDFTEKEIRYRKLLWRRDPFTYPRRLPAVAAGSTGDPLVFDELNPSESKRHLYLAYLGVQPGFAYFLYHPYDDKTLKWDEDVVKINSDLTANLSYEASPYEHPVRAVGIERDRYPSVSAKNLTGASAHPAVIWVAALYVYVPQAKFSPQELDRLQSGAIRSYPWDFGGQI